jgi:hypothetical protein
LSTIEPGKDQGRLEKARRDTGFERSINSRVKASEGESASLQFKLTTARNRAARE